MTFLRAGTGINLSGT